jgi:fluoride ion exporter CrcB/FEX
LLRWFLAREIEFMVNVKKIFAFLLANVVGFFSVGICYMIGLYAEEIEANSPNFNAEHFEEKFLTGTILVWAVCAALSLAYFFLEGKKGWVFLALPAILPLCYGLFVIFTV